METISYFPKKCIGCGICFHNATSLFFIDEISGKACLSDGVLKKDKYFRTLWPDEKKVAVELAQKCPTKAIVVA